MGNDVNYICAYMHICMHTHTDLCVYVFKRKINGSKKASEDLLTEILHAPGQLTSSPDQYQIAKF